MHLLHLKATKEVDFIRKKQGEKRIPLDEVRLCKAKKKKSCAAFECVCVCVLIMECYSPATLCGYTSRKTSCIYQMNLHGCKFSVRQLKKILAVLSRPSPTVVEYAFFFLIFF